MDTGTSLVIYGMFNRCTGYWPTANMWCGEVGKCKTNREFWRPFKRWQELGVACLPTHLGGSWMNKRRRDTKGYVWTWQFNVHTIRYCTRSLNGGYPNNCWLNRINWYPKYRLAEPPKQVHTVVTSTMAEPLQKQRPDWATDSWEVQQATQRPCWGSVEQCWSRQFWLGPFAPVKATISATKGSWALHRFAASYPLVKSPTSALVFYIISRKVSKESHVVKLVPFLDMWNISWWLQLRWR